MQPVVPKRVVATLAIIAVAGAGSAVVVAAVAAPASSGARGLADAQTIGPGTVLMRLRQSGPGGAIKAYVLRVDLVDPRVHAELLYPGSIAAVQRVSAMARQANAFAAVNGDFFNIGATNAPVGPAVTGGQLVKGPQRGRALAAGVGVDGVGRIAAVRLRGSVAMPGGHRPLSDLNDANPGFAPLLAPNGIGLFTPLWGTYTLAGAVRGLRSVTEVLVRGDRVARVSHGASSGAIARGGYVLLGAGRGGRALARLRVGQPVSIGYAQDATAPVPFRFAVGAKYVLLRAGAVQRGLPAGHGAPRTAIGFSQGGRVMYLVVTEGPRAGVPGLDIAQLALFLRGLGVRDAANLDDGGSTTIVARVAARAGLIVLNRPSDGSERRVANGVGLFAAM